MTAPSVAGRKACRRTALARRSIHVMNLHAVSAAIRRFRERNRLAYEEQRRRDLEPAGWAAPLSTAVGLVGLGVLFAWSGSFLFSAALCSGALLCLVSAMRMRSTGRPPKWRRWPGNSVSDREFIVMAVIFAGFGALAMMNVYLAKDRSPAVIADPQVVMRAGRAGETEHKTVAIRIDPGDRLRIDSNQLFDLLTSSGAASLDAEVRTTKVGNSIVRVTVDGQSFSTMQGSDAGSEMIGLFGGVVVMGIGVLAPRIRRAFHRRRQAA